MYYCMKFDGWAGSKYAGEALETQAEADAYYTEDETGAPLQWAVNADHVLGEVLECIQELADPANDDDYDTRATLRNMLARLRATGVQIPDVGSDSYIALTLCSEIFEPVYNMAKVNNIQP